MKKLLAVALILCLMVPIAHAEKQNDFIAAYMNAAPLYSAPEINAATLLTRNGITYWEFKSGAKLVPLTDNKQNLEGVLVTGTERSAGDFIAVSVCSIVAMDGDEKTDEIFRRVMAFYLDWRDHKEDFSMGYVTVNKIGVKMMYSSGVYQMVIGHTGL